MTRIAQARMVKSEILTAMDANTRISKRDRIIIRRVLGGESYKSVAKDFDIGMERVRGICFCAFRKLCFNL